MEKLNLKTMLIVASLFTFGMMILFAPVENATFWNAVALGGLMVFFWVFELLPIYVTALFPLVLAVPLGVLDTDQLSAAYGHRMVYLFFGGFVLSLALEKWDVHKQIAEGTLEFCSIERALRALAKLGDTWLVTVHE